MIYMKVDIDGNYRLLKDEPTSEDYRDEIYHLKSDRSSFEIMQENGKWETVK